MVTAKKNCFNASCFFVGVKPPPLFLPRSCKQGICLKSFSLLGQTFPSTNPQSSKALIRGSEDGARGSGYFKESWQVRSAVSKPSARAHTTKLLKNLESRISVSHLSKESLIGLVFFLKGPPNLLQFSWLGEWAGGTKRGNPPKAA